MTIGKFDLISEWLRPDENIRQESGRIYLKHKLVTRVETPDSYRRAIILLDCLLSLEMNRSFDGALLVVRESELWTETATNGLFNRLRALISSDQRKLQEAPVSAFDSSEVNDLYSLSLLAILGYWNATIISRSQEYIIDLSHDGFVSIASLEPNDVDDILRWLHKMGFDVH